MSYTVGYDFTSIPTNNSTEELNEIISSTLSDLTNLILNGNEVELAKLESGDELTEQYEEEIEELDFQTIFKELSSFVNVRGSHVVISSNTEEHRHFPQPLLKLFAPLMNKEFVTFYSVCQDSRDGIGAVASILTKEGDQLSIDEETISIHQ